MATQRVARSPGRPDLNRQLENHHGESNCEGQGQDHGQGFGEEGRRQEPKGRCCIEGPLVGLLIGWVREQLGYILDCSRPHSWACVWVYA